MSKPLVAVIGRPNVGKSTFFNYLAGRRLSIVDDTPGVTRDRLYAETEWRGREFVVIDTGGIEPESQDELLGEMRAQAQVAIDTADVIVLLTDLQAGMTDSDSDIAQMLRKSGKPVVVAVNKADHVGPPPDGMYEFYQLGLGEPMPISSAHRLGVGDLLDRVYDLMPPEDDGPGAEGEIHVAVIGKPNAGKSSLVNCLLGERRAIVSDMPGTTRDAVDARLEHELGTYILIDTAGLRRKSRIDNVIERYSMIRTVAAVERADVCVILIDGEDGPTEQDTKVAGLAHNAGKACILAVNKWDLVDREQHTMATMRRQVQERFSFMPYAPVAFLSAKTGYHTAQLLTLINDVFEQAGRRLSTGVLNDLLSEATAMVPTPQDKGKHLKIYYMTQVAVRPPQFVLFVNDRELSHFSYERYLENQIRKNFGFDGTPIRFYLRERNRKSLTDIRKGRSPDGPDTP